MTTSRTALCLATLLVVPLGCRGSEPEPPEGPPVSMVPAGDGWVGVTDREARVVAQFPSSPSRQAASTVVDGASGTVIAIGITVSDATFVLNVINWPTNLETRDVDTMLEKAWQGGLQRLPNAKVLLKKPVSIDGHRGFRGTLQTTSKSGESRTFHVLSFIAGSRTVLAMVEHASSLDRTVEAERFLGSVRDIP